MEVNRLQLLSALTIAKNTAASNPISPVLGCYCFTGKELVTFDGVRSTVVPFETDFAGGVPSVLLTMVSKYKAEEVSLESSGTTMKLKCGRSKDELVLIPPEAFLWEDKQEVGELSISLSSEMYAALRILLVCADKNCLHTNTNGIYLVKRGRSAYFASTNSNVIGIRRMPSIRLKTEDFCILIPYGFIELLGNMDFEHNMLLEMRGTSVACIDEVSNIVMTTKLVKFSDMPDCLGFLEQAKSFLEIEIPEDFLDTVERAVCLEKNVTKPIKFEFTPDQQLILSAKSTFGSVEETHDVEYSGEAVSYFNGMDLLPILKGLDIHFLHFCESNGVPSLLLLTDGSDDAFKLLISSVRV